MCRRLQAEENARASGDAYKQPSVYVEEKKAGDKAQHQERDLANVAAIFPYVIYPIIIEIYNNSARKNKIQLIIDLEERGKWQFNSQYKMTYDFADLETREHYEVLNKKEARWEQLRKERACFTTRPEEWERNEGRRREQARIAAAELAAANEKEEEMWRRSKEAQRKAEDR